MAHLHVSVMATNRRVLRWGQEALTPATYVDARAFRVHAGLRAEFLGERRWFWGAFDKWHCDREGTRMLFYEGTRAADLFDLASQERRLAMAREALFAGWPLRGHAISCPLPRDAREDRGLESVTEGGPEHR